MSNAIEKQNTGITSYDYGDNAGLGFEGQTNEDATIPYLLILQALSPQISKPAQKIPGAELGMLMNSVSKELYDGTKGVIIQPCATSHRYLEWKPRKEGGGLVAQYGIDDAVVLKCKETQEFGKYTVGKNPLIETFNIAGLLHNSENLDEVDTDSPQPIVLGFTSTKVKTYKNIMSRLRQMKGAIPLFAHRLHVTTFIDSNSEGDFGNFIIKPLVNDNVKDSLISPGYTALLDLGRGLSQAYTSGKARGNVESSTGHDGESKEDKPPF